MKRRSIDAIISQALAQGPTFQADFARQLDVMAVAKRRHVHQLSWRDWEKVLEDCLAAAKTVQIKVDRDDVIP